MYFPGHEKLSRAQRKAGPPSTPRGFNGARFLRRRADPNTVHEIRVIRVAKFDDRSCKQRVAFVRYNEMQFALNAQLRQVYAPAEPVVKYYISTPRAGSTSFGLFSRPRMKSRDRSPIVIRVGEFERDESIARVTFLRARTKCEFARPRRSRDRRERFSCRAVS